MSCKVSEIKKICKKYNIELIEDAAEAVGSFYKNKHLGTLCNFGILSFNGNKTITSGGGGAILTKSKKIAETLRHSSTHAKLKIKLDHFHDKIGFNYRMINLAAAVGCAQLEKLATILTAKRKIYKSYENIFNNNKEVKLVRAPKYCKSNYWLNTLIFKNKIVKQNFIKNFKKKGFSLRYTWRPLKSLTIFKNCPSDKLEISKDIFERSINLPSSPILGFKK